MLIKAEGLPCQADQKIRPLAMSFLGLTAGLFQNPVL